ncbi:MAG: DUF4845 domain-containing protein [Steroidobacterales bacterium]
MRRTQRGITFVGWLVLMVPIAIVVYAGIRLAPIYLNYMRVTRSLQQLADENKGGEASNPASVQMLKNSLEKRFDIESIDHPAVKDIDIHRDGDHWVAIANYEDVAPLFGNISILVQFDRQVDIP